MYNETSIIDRARIKQYKYNNYAKGKHQTSIIMMANASTVFIYYIYIISLIINKN